MLHKDYRLNKSKDIKQTSMRGRSFFNPFFVIKYKKSAQLSPNNPIIDKSISVPRFAFIVSTKVSKKAVERNRLKRIAREQIRLSLPQMKQGEYVIIVKQKAKGLEPKVLKKSLLSTLESGKLLDKRVANG